VVEALLLPLLLPGAAAAAAALPPFPLTEHAVQARERALDLLSATAARNTDGADHLPVTAAPVATLPSALALVAQLPRHHPLRLLLQRFLPMVLADPREVLLALARHSVTAARSTDGVDLLQDTAVLDARADRVLATRRLLI
jgi:hypothetical protein